MNNTSPAGYRLLRKEFDDRIPAPVTLRSWHANADINAEPGILNQSLEVLKLKVAEKAANNQKLMGALLFDEMAIRKHLQWCNNKMIGFEKIPEMDCKSAQLAKEVLVFMFSDIDDNWQIPVAYYFISSIDGEEKCGVLHEVVRRVLQCGVLITNITFDGHKSNPAACQFLGAILDVYSDLFNTSINVDGIQIDIMFDPSHLEKLFRNSIAGGLIYDSERKPIKWVYVERLVRFEGRRNFGSMHKMTQAHVDFHSNIMNVKLAVQTLSASTANAIEFLMKQGHSEFKGAEPLIKFMRVCNDFFDIFNSTKSTTSSNPLKQKMSEENAQQIFTVFQETTEYFKSLLYRNKSGKLVPLCSSILKTGFQGAVVNMKSLTSIYEKLVVSKQIDRIPTHYLSQDHLEAFFGKIRAFNFNGNNRNPTCQQFNAAMRKLLANTTIHCSVKGNCMILDQPSVCNPYSNISTITSRRSKKLCSNESQNFTPEDIEEVMKELDEIQSTRSTSQLVDLGDLTASYIASTIENSILSSATYNCEFCKDVFHENEQVAQAFTSDHHTRVACRSTFEICRAADYFLKLELLKGQFDSDLIFHSIFSSLCIAELYPESSFSHCPSHKTELIRDVLNKYIKYKGTYLAKTVSLGEAEKTIRQAVQ